MVWLSSCSNSFLLFAPCRLISVSFMSLSRPWVKRMTKVLVSVGLAFDHQWRATAHSFQYQRCNMMCLKEPRILVSVARLYLGIPYFHCFLNFNVHRNKLRILLICLFWFSRSWAGLRFCISNKAPEQTGAAGPWTTLYRTDEARVSRKPESKYFLKFCALGAF